MTGESTTPLCPRCHNKLLWNGAAYRCIACDYTITPKTPKKDLGKPPKRSGK